jgi:hypothetical protein
MGMARADKLTPAAKTLVLALAAWGLAMIVPDFWRVFVEFGTLGIRANNDGVIYADPGEPARSLGIEKGDRIDLKRMACPGLSCGDLLSVFGGLGGVQYVQLGHAVTLDVIPAGCSGPPAPVGVRSVPAVGGARACEVAVTLHPVQAPLSLAEKVTLLLDQLLGTFFIVLAALLLWHRPSAMTWGFFLYGLWFNPGQTFVAYAALQRHPTLFILEEGAQALAQAAGYIGFLLFALRFPDNTVEARWRALLRGLPYLGAALAMMQLLSFGTSFGFPTETVTRASYLAGYAVQLVVVVVLWARLRGQAPEDRQRTRWVIWSCFIGLPAFIVADSLQSTNLWGSWSPSETTINLLYVLNAGVAVAVYHAVRWHRVVDVRFTVSRAATLLTTWIIAGTLLGLGGYSLEHFFVELRVQATLLVVLVIGLTLVFEQIHAVLNRACDRFLFRQLHQAEERLRRVELTLPQADSPEAIDGLLVHEPVAALRLEAAAIFARRGDGSFDRRTPGINWPQAWRMIPAADSLVGHLEGTGKPVRLEKMEWPRDGVPTDAPRPALAIPVMTCGVLVAVGLYGAHVTGDDLNAEEVSMLAQLARAAGAAYDHVEVTLLRRQLGELRRAWQPVPGG